MRLRVAILLLASPARARVCESSDVARRSRTPDPKLTAAGFSGEFERPIVDWKIKGCFSLNAEGVDAAGAKLLVPYLRSNRDLMQLHFLGSSLGDAGCKAIASVLERNLWINVLTLQANDLGIECAKALGAMLRKNSGLRVLNLGLNTELGAAGVAAVVAGLAENEGLDMLSLSETGLNATGAKALADGLRTNPHMENLYLDGNEIGDEGAAALASALGADSRLDGSGFAPSLSGNVSGVKRLYLMRNEIGNAGGEALARAAERNARLEDVNLDDNPLDADIVERVRDATDRTPEERARAAAAARSGMGDAERAREEVDERDPASLDRYFKLNPPPRVPELWAKPLIPEGDEDGGREGQGAAFPGPWKAGFNAPEKKLEEELVERRKGEL
jgi:hypothetical protein